MQPGMEMLPMGAGGMPGLDGGEAKGLGGLLPSDLEESLRGAPDDVLAAAARMSLIPPTIGSGLGVGVGGEMRRGLGGAVVTDVPGEENTDVGRLSVS